MKIMRTLNIQKWLAALLCVLAVGSTAARAEPDTVYLGDGHDGPLTVSAVTQINRYAQVTADIQPASSSIQVDTPLGDSTSSPEQRLLMVFQATGIDPIPASGATAAIGLEGKPVGTWELARVSKVTGLTVTLTNPLVHGFKALVTQVIVVPQYTDVTISALGQIVPYQWDGKIGGVVAFLVKGTLTHNGKISASEAGFRGGKYVLDTSNATACADADQAGNNGGARKGEGLVNTRYDGPSDTGRGNLANGGGGGVCNLSGGGGGAGAGVTTTKFAPARGGAGGHGGDSVDKRPVGGTGGAPIFFTAPNRLMFGGGGGAGHGRTADGKSAGKGGGIIFVRASQLTGTGVFETSGGAPEQSTQAGGGGGGGGTLHLRFKETVSCGNLIVSGGTGGRTTEATPGPGGGGGGGYVFLQSKGGGCAPGPYDLIGAAAGTQKQGTVANAEPGRDGQFVNTEDGYMPFVPITPVIQTPENGARTSKRKPLISGTGEANSTLTLTLNNGAPYKVQVNSSGNWEFMPPTDLADATYTVTVMTTNTQGDFSPNVSSTFTVDNQAPAVPVVKSPDDGATETDTTPTVTGTSEPNAVITLIIDGVVITTPSPIRADDSGKWSYTLETPLAPGSHTVTARATDAAGNTSDKSATNTFTVAADSTSVPDTTITSGPTGTGNGRSATFEFGPGEPGVSYECRLDGGPWEPCTSPTTYNDLADGEHTFEVRARDAAGNVDPTPDTRTWSVSGGLSGEVDFRGDGFGCSASGGAASLVLMALGSVLAMARRRRQG